MSSVIKVYPSEEKLSTINTIVSCPEDGCSSVFASESNLNLHLAKTHNKSHLLKSDSAVKQYHCPVSACAYNDSASFKTLKLLKQHYLKKHSKKNYVCEKCNKGFATESFAKSHKAYCGINFQCRDCSNAYSSYETLKTHCRRKKHSLFEKAFYNTSAAIAEKSIVKLSKSDICSTSKKVLLPKSSHNLQLLIVSTNKSNLIEQGTQTDVTLDLSKLLRKEVQNETRKVQACAETQTPNNYFCEKQLPEYLANPSEDYLSKTSITTQTKPIYSETKSCNTVGINCDNCYDYFGESSTARTSSGTQTVDSVQTETLCTGTLNDDFDPTLFNCNTETQTDLFGDDLFNYCDYYTNMCTQTCEDLIMEELGFNETQTQTVFDDVVRSVGSQTTMSPGRRNVLSCRDMANMETQTSLEVLKMLQEISS